MPPVPSMLLSALDERVARAPAAACVLRKKPVLDQSLNVAKRRVMRALLELRPLRGGELPSKPSSSRLIRLLSAVHTGVESAFGSTVRRLSVVLSGARLQTQMSNC